MAGGTLTRVIVVVGLGGLESSRSAVLDSGAATCSSFARPTIQAMPIVISTPAAIATAKFTLSFVSLRLIGLRTSSPVVDLPPVPCISGAWILTSSLALGIVMIVLHFLHGPCFPAN